MGPLGLQCQVLASVLGGGREQAGTLPIAGPDSGLRKADGEEEINPCCPASLEGSLHVMSPARSPAHHLACSRHLTSICGMNK